MKTGLKDVIGKEVAAVVVAEAGQDPRQQVFFVFRDGTCFEFYGRDFTCCEGLDPAERIERYVESGGSRIVRVYGDAMAVSSPPPPRVRPGRESQSVEELLTRDLAAWRLTKDVIAKASRPMP